ncbi:MAG: hypothetical protein RL095_1145 [Verrucomicrobiota bacterium]|jgi:dihydroxyacetone kinase phosphoprotein-dependent L subunit
MSPADFRRAAAAITAKINAECLHLCELDSAVGDGDHGTTIQRGTKAGLEKLQAAPPASLSEDLMSFSMGMLSSMGGASGPIYGSFFQGMAMAAKGHQAADAPLFLAMLKQGLAQIQKIGKAEPGDKTLIDSLLPAIQAYEAALAEGADFATCLQRMSAAAWQGVEHTKTLVSKRGRSRYAGERGLGHADAGATSMALMLECLANNAKGETSCAS